MHLGTEVEALIHVDEQDETEDDDCENGPEGVRKGKKDSQGKRAVLGITVVVIVVVGVGTTLGSATNFHVFLTSPRNRLRLCAVFEAQLKDFFNLVSTNAVKEFFWISGAIVGCRIGSFN